MDRLKTFFSKVKTWAGDHPAQAGLAIGGLVVLMYWLFIGRRKKAASGQVATLASYSPGVSGTGGSGGGSEPGAGDTGQALDPNLVNLMDQIGDLSEALKQLMNQPAPHYPGGPVTQPDVVYPPAEAIPTGGGMNVPARVYDIFRPEELGSVVRGDFSMKEYGGLDSYMSVFTNDLDWAAKIEQNPRSSVVPLTPGSKFVMAFTDPVSSEQYAADRARVSAITGKSGSISSQLSAPSDNGGASDQAKLQTLIKAGLARSGDDPIWG